MYRIISKINNASSDKREEIFLIQRKSIFGWKTITIDEDQSSKDVEHSSYEEAEEYLYSKYLNGWGEIHKSGNVYTFHAYTMCY
jgi:hypothetical protein